jgi:hypothetical protein
VTATARSVELRAVAQEIADALPTTVEEVVLTGSVSRGVADDISDIEMLIVTEGDVDLGDCFLLAASSGVTDLGTWGEQDTPTKRVSGRRDAVPVELIWWSHAYADSALDSIFTGAVTASADAIANGLPLRTSGLLALWQERLRHYPDELAAAQIEAAALKWGGFHAAGLLTLLRPGERLALLEWLVDDAVRIVRIVFALNRVWPPTLKRIADRTAALRHKPERLAERIADALSESDPRQTLLAMTELQLETLALAPRGPNVVRARAWVGEGRRILARHPPLTPAA